MKKIVFLLVFSVLCGGLSAAVTVQKAPLKGLLIDNASVVTNVTGSDAAKRLETATGNAWIDAAGARWSKQKVAEWDGAVSRCDVGDGGSFHWDFGHPEWLTMSVWFDAPDGWHAQRSRIEDVEAGDGSGIVQEEVFYDFGATAPSNASSVVLYCTSDRTIATTIRISDAICEVDRFATTGEVARIASGISGGLATNDVCAIVTNTVEGGWSWEMMPPFVSATEPVFHKWHLPDGGFGGASWEAVAIMEDGYRMPIRVDVPESGEFATKLVFEFIGTATRIPGGNALGLAMAKDAVSAEAVTNIVRDAIGTVWDGALGVAWEARMHNGHLYYIAVTNRQEVK